MTTDLKNIAGICVVGCWMFFEAYDSVITFCLTFCAACHSCIICRKNISPRIYLRWNGYQIPNQLHKRSKGIFYKQSREQRYKEETQQNWFVGRILTVWEQERFCYMPWLFRCSRWFLNSLPECIFVFCLLIIFNHRFNFFPFVFSYCAKTPTGNE